MDLLPTVLDVLDWRLPARLDGQSLLAPHSRPIYAESFSSHTMLAANRGDRWQRTIIDGHWKFIRASSRRPELYDLAVDPQETRNLWQPASDVAQALNSRLAGLTPEKASGSSTGGPDRQTMESLKSLGYVQ